MVQKVLIVDDSPAELQNLQTILTKRNLQITTANSGKQAVEIAKSTIPDLIFMDIVMGEMDGFEALRALQKEEETKAIPVIFVSSKNQKADKVYAKAKGAKGYVTKPYTEEEIFEQLDSI